MKIIKVKVYPNKKETKTIKKKGRADIDLHIHLAAEAKNNKANAELIHYLGQEFKIPQDKIKIIKGSHSRIKEIVIAERNKL